MSNTKRQIQGFKGRFSVFPPSSLALEEETDSMSQDTSETLPEEDRLEEASEKDALLGSSGTPDVEDSFL